LEIEIPIINNVSSNTQAEADEYFRLLNLKIANSQKNNIGHLKASNPIINFYIENTKITGVSPAPDTLEFDITVNTTSSNIYLENAAMRLTYNSSIFGHTVFTDGLVKATRGTVISNKTVYQDPVLMDYSQDTLVIGVGTGYSTTGSLGSRTLINSTKKQLLHLKFTFKNPRSCLAKANMSFVNFPQLSQLVEFYTLTANAPYDGSAVLQYEANASTNLASFPLCTDPVITDFSPRTINAGRGTPFHIDGYNLGNRTTGSLFFKNCDDGGVKSVQIDKVDITAWTNTSIDLIFPSECDSGQTNSKNQIIPGCLGSGTFTIFNDTKYGSNPVSMPFGVHYSIVTERIPPAAGVKNVKLPRNVIKKDKTGGYLFTMSKAVKNNPQAVKLIINALGKWRCATGINFRLDTLNTSEAGLRGTDGINTINFSDTIKALAKTLTSSIVCGKPYILDIDIVFKSPSINNWFMGAETDSIKAGQFDFLQVVLHELGHAHNLNHVNEKNEIMYYSTGSTSLAAVNRRVNISSGSGAFDGGNYVTSYSIGTTCASVNYPTMTYSSDCSYHVGWMEQNVPNKEDLGASLNIFPNPFENIINVEFELSTNAETQVSLLNMFGEEISSTKQNQLAEGTHTISFNENLSSGIYLIHLMVNNRSYTKKVIKY
jgi:hypothetical protein